MLNKSILLNLRMAKNDMGILMGVLICFLVLLLIGINSFAFPVMGCLSIYLIARIVIYIRVINKVFFQGFFEQEGTMYMTLPIPARDMILGKMLTVSGCFFLIDMLYIISTFSVILLTGGDADALLTSMANNLPSLEGSRMELALAFGLLPLWSFASTLASSGLLLSIFLKFGLQKKKLFFCWIVYGIVLGLLSFLLDQFSGILEKLSFGAAIDSVLEIAIYLGLAYALMQYCINCLEKKFQV